MVKSRSHDRGCAEYGCAGARRIGPVPHVTHTPVASPPNQTWNELPQPQLLTTFGLLKTKPRFSRPS